MPRAMLNPSVERAPRSDTPPGPRGLWAMNGMIDEGR